MSELRCHSLSTPILRRLRTRLRDRVDLSNGAIPGRCGSHTATGVPDLANDRLLIYNSGSGCDGFDIVEVPLSSPSTPAYLRTVVAGRNCHDVGVILGDANMVSCAGGDGFTLWTLTGGHVDRSSFLDVEIRAWGQHWALVRL